MKLTLKIVILLFLFGCEERFETDFEQKGASQINIIGQINQLDGYATVMATQGQSLGKPPQGVSNLDIRLYHENEFEEFIEEKVGVYKTQGKICGKPDETYWIELHLANGNKYVSTPEKMPYLIGETSLTLTQTVLKRTSQTGIDIENDAIDCTLKATFPDTEEPFFFYWYMEETYKVLSTDLGYPYDVFGLVPPPCYVTELLSNSPENLISSLTYKKSNLSLSSFAIREIDKSFLFKHFFSVYHQSTTAEYLEFLKKVSAVTNTTGSLFDPPPGKLIGNIARPDGTSSNEISGYFASVMQEVQLEAIFPTNLDLENTLKDDCLWSPQKPIEDYPQICLDCTKIARSTTQLPDYWVE